MSHASQLPRGSEVVSISGGGSVQLRDVWIYSRWERSGLSVLAGAGLCGGAALGFYQATLSHQPVLTNVVTTLFIGVLVAGYVALTVHRTFVRAIQLSSNGVRFLIARRETFVPWADLLPPQAPLLIGITFGYREDGSGRSKGGLFVTGRQARAILAHPGCPSFPLPSKVWKSLGVSPPVVQT